MSRSLQALRGLGLAMVAAVALTVTTSHAIQASSPIPAPASVDQELVMLLNEARRDAGVPELVVATAASDVAAVRAMDMASQGYFAHINPQGVGPVDVLAEQGTTYRAFGENIARADYPLDQVAGVMHAALLASPGHRANMLNAAYGRVGIAAVLVASETYVAVIFLD